MSMDVHIRMSYSRSKLHYCFVLDNMSPEQAIETAYLILLPDIKDISKLYTYTGHHQTFRAYRPNLIVYM